MNSETQNNRILRDRVIYVAWLSLVKGWGFLVAATGLALWIVGFEAAADPPTRYFFMLGTVVGFLIVVTFAGRAVMRVLRDAKMCGPGEQMESKHS